jgi:hypothetical protein
MGVVSSLPHIVHPGLDGGAVFWQGEVVSLSGSKYFSYGFAGWYFTNSLNWRLRLR